MNHPHLQATVPLFGDPSWRWGGPGDIGGVRGGEESGFLGAFVLRACKAWSNHSIMTDCTAGTKGAAWMKEGVSAEETSQGGGVVCGVM